MRQPCTPPEHHRDVREKFGRRHAVLAAATGLAAAAVVGVVVGHQPSPPSPDTATTSSTGAAADTTTPDRVGGPRRRVAELVDADPRWRRLLDGGATAAGEAAELCSALLADHEAAALRVYDVVHHLGHDPRDPDRNAAWVEVMEEALPMLCPEHAGVIDDVRQGRVRLIAQDGTNLVQPPHEAGSALNGRIVPGTYRVDYPATGCEWARMGTGDRVVERGRAIAGRPTTVTVRAEDVALVILGCGNRWYLQR